MCIGLGLLLSGARGRRFTPAEKLRYAEGIVMNYYVDTVNEESLVEAGINGMLKELDPHSSYTNAEETRAMNEPLDGSFSGIGITFNMNQDTLYVIQTVSGGPSERVGILAGDRIVAVNDTNIAGVKIKNSDIMKRLRGKKGTKVDVRVLRRTTGRPDQLIDFTITRADIPIYSVDAAYMVDARTGYIRVNKFANTTPKEFNEAVTKLKKLGMQNLILDLTDNGGGYMSAAVSMLGEILDPGSMAVYMEGENNPRQNFRTQPSGVAPLLDGCRLVVMVNQYSASASEIVSGAIQDWDRGAIVGRRSFGKGLVQRPFPFPDGSMIRLTVAHYYTPTGRDIQKPYEKGNKKSYHQDLIDRYNNGELMHADSIHYVDSLAVRTLVNGRTIYGGGGISPDRFVPLDTTFFTDYYRDLTAKGVLNQYAIRYTDLNRKTIKKTYKTPERFIAGFTVTPAMINEITAMGEAEGIKLNEQQLDRSLVTIQNVVKAIIGRDVYNEETFFRILNEDNDIFQAALELINSDDYDKVLNEGGRPSLYKLIRTRRR